MYLRSSSDALYASLSCSLIATCKTSLSNFERYLGSIGIFKDRPTTPILNQAEVSSYTNLLCGTIMPYIESQAAIKSKKHQVLWVLFLLVWVLH